MEFKLINACLQMEDLGEHHYAKRMQTTSYCIPNLRKLIPDMESHGVPTNLNVGQSLRGPNICVEFRFNYEQWKFDHGSLKIKGLRKLVKSVVYGGGWEVNICLCIFKIFASSRAIVAPLPTSSKYSFPVYQNGRWRGTFEQPLYLITDTNPAERLADLCRGSMDNPPLINLKIKFSLSLECRPVVGWNPDVPYQLAYANKMLTEELFADVTIIAGNGSEIKAHRSVLAARSSVFAAMFQHGMKEATSGILELREMSEGSIRALLEFLYAWKRKGAEENPLVCVELLEAGHKYDIPSMENFMRSILMKKPDDWFTPDAVLKLILFVKFAQLKDLRKKAVRLLKSMEKEVKSLPGFQDLCDENGKTDVELFKYLKKRLPKS